MFTKLKHRKFWQVLTWPLENNMISSRFVRLGTPH